MSEIKDKFVHTPPPSKCSLRYPPDPISGEKRADDGDNVTISFRPRSDYESASRELIPESDQQFNLKSSNRVNAMSTGAGDIGEHFLPSRNARFAIIADCYTTLV